VLASCKQQQSASQMQMRLQQLLPLQVPVTALLLRMAHAAR
jgi:hypothetical protein